MLLPQELKKKAFTHSKRGYEESEVDEYIDFLIEKYSEIYAQCDRYDKKLRLVAERISEMQSEEEAIKKLTVSTQKLCDSMLAEAESEAARIRAEAETEADSIISDARERSETVIELIRKKSEEKIEAVRKNSDDLLLAVRTRCANILNEFKKEITVQKESLSAVRDLNEDFSSRLLTMYKKHLDELKSNTPEITLNLDDFEESKLLNSIMKDIKNDAMKMASDDDRIADMNFSEELDMLKTDKSISNVLQTSSRGDTLQRENTSAHEKNAESNEASADKTRTFAAYKAAEESENREEDDKSSTTVFDAVKNKEEFKEIKPENLREKIKPLDDIIEDIDKENDTISTYDSDDYDDYLTLGGGSDSDDTDDYEEVYEVEEKNDTGKRRGFFGFLRKDKEKKAKKVKNDDIEDDNDNDFEDSDDGYDDFDDDDDDYYGLNDRKNSKDTVDIFED